MLANAIIQEKAIIGNCKTITLIDYLFDLILRNLEDLIKN